LNRNSVIVDGTTPGSAPCSCRPSAQDHGIFASNSAGPARWNQLYASNMNDSGTYVGACLRQCDVTMDHMWMENNSLGYSGTNSGRGRHHRELPVR
jgi:hypothetical protein